MALCSRAKSQWSSHSPVHQLFVTPLRGSPVTGSGGRPPSSVSSEPPPRELAQRPGVLLRGPVDLAPVPPVRVAVVVDRRPPRCRRDRARPRPGNDHVAVLGEGPVVVRREREPDLARRLQILVVDDPVVDLELEPRGGQQVQEGHGGERAVAGEQPLADHAGAGVEERPVLRLGPGVPEGLVAPEGEARGPRPPTGAAPRRRVVEVVEAQPDADPDQAQQAERARQPVPRRDALQRVAEPHREPLPPRQPHRPPSRGSRGIVATDAPQQAPLTPPSRGADSGAAAVARGSPVRGRVPIGHVRVCQLATPLRHGPCGPVEAGSLAPVGGRGGRPRPRRPSGQAGNGQVAKRATAKWPSGQRPSGQAGNGQVATPGAQGARRVSITCRHGSRHRGAAGGGGGGVGGPRAGCGAGADGGGGARGDLRARSRPPRRSGRRARRGGRGDPGRPRGRGARGGLRGGGRGGPGRAGRHPRGQRRRAAPGHVRDDRARWLPVGAGAQLPLDDRHVPRRRPGDARARLGPGRRDHLPRGASAHGEPHRLVRPPARPSPRSSSSSPSRRPAMA